MQQDHHQQQRHGHAAGQWRRKQMRQRLGQQLGGWEGMDGWVCFKCLAAGVAIISEVSAGVESPLCQPGAGCEAGCFGCCVRNRDAFGDT